MRIDNNFPAPEDLISNEIETLNFIHGKEPKFWEMYPALAANAKTEFFKLNNAKKKKNFLFESEVDIFFDGDERKIGKAHFGANITLKDSKKYDMVSYYISICQKVDSKYKMIRKYHFDYVPDEIKSRQPHPVFHLQYAGKLSLKLQKLELEHNHMDQWLSEPRLFYSPVSLALIINIILTEFPNPTTYKIISTNEWRSQIKKNENLVLAPFYKMCHALTGSSHPERLLTTDFFYGKSW
jgi:hypothetical protein